jgi:hypothetical protein
MATKIPIQRIITGKDGYISFYDEYRRIKMQEIFDGLIEKIVSAADRVFELLTGHPNHKLQETRERIPDYRRIAYVYGQLRRLPSSGFTCDRH